MKQHLSNQAAHDYITMGDAKYDKATGVLTVKKGPKHPATGVWKRSGESEGFIRA